MIEWLIERLDNDHERQQFQCGQPALDAFLHTLVSQYQKRKLGRTYVAVRPGERRVLGYYTLASSCVRFENLPKTLARKLPRHSLPVALLARLAIDISVQGHGLGRLLLGDALHRCLELSEEVGLHAVEVVAIDDDARRFYANFGFVPLPDSERHLYLPIATIAASVQAAARPLR